MRRIHLLTVLLLLNAGVCYSAGFQQETEQRQQINYASSRKMDAAKKDLNKSINQAVSDMREGKRKIPDLAKAWDRLQGKSVHCIFYDALNKNAEISARNVCLLSEYQVATPHMVTQIFN